MTDSPRPPPLDRSPLAQRAPQPPWAEAPLDAPAEDPAASDFVEDPQTYDSQDSSSMLPDGLDPTLLALAAGGGALAALVLGSLLAALALLG